MDASSTQVLLRSGISHINRLSCALVVAVAGWTFSCAQTAAPKTASPKLPATTPTTSPWPTFTPTTPSTSASTDLLLRLDPVGQSGREFSTPMGQTLTLRFQVSGTSQATDVGIAMGRIVQGMSLNSADKLNPVLTWTPTVGATSEAVSIVLRDMKKCQRLILSGGSCAISDGAGYDANYDKREDYLVKVTGTSVTPAIGATGGNSAILSQLLPLVTGMLGGSGGGNIQSLLSGMSGGQLQQLLGQLQGGGGASGAGGLSSLLNQIMSGFALDGQIIPDARVYSQDEKASFGLIDSGH